MSKTGSVAISAPTSLWGRLLATIDRLLRQSAESSIRHVGLPHFGLHFCS